MRAPDWEKRIRNELNAAGYDVVEVRLEERARLDIIKVFIDRDGGVSIDDCTAVSRNLNDLIVVHELFEKDYRLEVSSPGLNRPLRTVKEFSRQVGWRIAVTVGGERNETVEGTLVAVDDEAVELKLPKGNIRILIADIVEGTVVLPW